MNDDDHADAAGKHLEDARTLLAGARYDGAAYLAGYVVECALKAVILHDQAFDPALGNHDAPVLQRWHRLLSSRPYGHDLLRLAGEVLHGHGARYAVDLPRGGATRATILDWRETRRYSAPGYSVRPGVNAEQEAGSYVEWANYVYEQSVLRMRLDMVI